MASRFYALMFVALTGILGMVSQSDLALMTAQAQPAQGSKVEADRLLDACRNDLKTSKNQQALQDCQQAAEVYKAIGDLSGQWKGLVNLGIAYASLGKYDKAIDSYLQGLEIAREIKDRLAEGNVLGNLGLSFKPC
jgi:tetratricopeptide (TPR) repeat protein